MGASASGTLGQDLDTVVISSPGDMGTVAIQITGVFSGTILFEGSVDGGTTYVARLASSGIAIASSTTTTGNWRVNASGYSNVRAKMHPYSSGSAAIVLRYGAAESEIAVTNISPSADITLMASTAQTTTQTFADQVNPGARGLQVVLDMTVVGTGSVTLEIDGKDSVSGKYYALLTGAAVITNVTNVYRVYPGLTVAANATVSDVLPHVWRCKITANNANSATYSVGASYLP